jgi:N6-adenosine-specific RNA methylase IME4
MRTIEEIKNALESFRIRDSNALNSLSYSYPAPTESDILAFTIGRLNDATGLLVMLTEYLIQRDEQ